MLKKPNLDPNSLKNFRPISNLSLFFKTLALVVAKQLINYLTSNNLSHSLQSAYMPKKSTETALTKLTSDLRYNDLLPSIQSTTTYSSNVYKKSVSPAFDWLTSFITGRTTSICIENQSSPARTTTHGVPQRSVLGPILFKIYIIPLLNLIDMLQINFRNYADDIQLYT